ncbi:MFS general substrate transporter [Patellaria atrata CBS 101060]|uniref:MFS general substrate transporter n=1 Tax=Patellaria atrata CBS 101060 TaxID=1346257 RepID=A0A9P4SE88_9PEZI|nr:MFS general substrate transporter [Patellaria atrata CBS 101060]
MGFRARNQQISSRVDGSAPFPYRQLFVLALCRICEPIAFMSIFPYIYFMIESFHITSNEKQIAIYAGMVTSAFAFAEFSSGVFWGRLSDRVGRKPILLTGMAGTGLSMLLFGFSRNLPLALLARALGGLLNGNIGVIQTTVAEVVTVEAHQPRAYAIMPFVWCLGSIIGSGLGGTLANPVQSYPTTFQEGSIFDKFPYLLPNLVCTCVVVFGLIVGFLFLEETHEDKRGRTDYGLELGNLILRLFVDRISEQPISEKDAYLEETVAFLGGDERSLSYRATEDSTLLTCAEVLALDPPENDLIMSNNMTEKTNTRAAFTPQVILNIISYGVLALHTISFEQLMPVLFSMKESHESIDLPFKFTGGLELPTKTIGYILSIQGFLQMLVQLFIFPIVNKRLGSLTTFRLVIFGYPIVYFLTPYLVLLPGNLRMVAVYLVILCKVTGQSLSYPCLVMMMANMAPSRKILGTLNGSAASSASLCRAIGPTLSGFIQVCGLNMGYSGLPWWVCSVISFVGALVSMSMKEVKTRFQVQDQFLDEESVLGRSSDTSRRLVKVPVTVSPKNPSNNSSLSGQWTSDSLSASLLLKES